MSLFSSLIQEVIYFDSYLIEFDFIQIKSLCCELFERQRERKKKRTDRKESMER